MKKFLLISAAMCALSLSVAHSDELDGHFKLLDKDGDGRLSREEASLWGWPDAKFDWADLNNDYFVDLQEFRSWIFTKRTRTRMLNLDDETFAQMDTDRDGQISYKGECWCTEDLFRKLDVNKNGFLSHAEAFRKARPALKVIKQKRKKSKK